MGLFDSFRKNKKDNSQQSNVPSNDIELKYSSGIDATVNFGNVVDYDGKHLQEVNLMYTENGKFVVSKIYMDPHNGLDQDGKSIYNTKEYFSDLLSSNKGLVKGFFEKNSVNSMETNYIGSIGTDSKGNYNRSIDHNFVRKYSKILAAEKEQKKIQTKNRNKDEDDKFRSSLKEETNSGYQNMCDNVDRNYNQRQNQGIHQAGR